MISHDIGVSNQPFVLVPSSSQQENDSAEHSRLRKTWENDLPARTFKPRKNKKTGRKWYRPKISIRMQKRAVEGDPYELCQI